MKGINRVELAGVLEKDPRLTETTAGPVLELRLRVEENLGGKHVVNWFPLVAWGEVATALHRALGGQGKGTYLWVAGRLHNRGAGEKARTRVVVQEFHVGQGASTAARLRELTQRRRG